MRTASAEIRTVQALRAAACLSVVAYHALGGAWANGAAGVDLFFVISGLVMGLSAAQLAPRPDGWRIFAMRRLRRLVPLYWTMTAAKLLIGVAIPATLAATRPSAWNILASFLFIPSRDGAGLVRPVLGVGWTLQFEALFYALMALALALHRPPLRVLLPVLLPLAVAGLWRQPDWPALLALANGLVLEFSAGLFLARFAGRIADLPAAAAGCLLGGGFVLLLGIPEPGAWRCLLWGGPAAAILAGALGLERKLGCRVPGVVLLLGEASYAIYLVHPFLTPVLARTLGGLPAALVMVSLAVCSLAGVVLDGVVDRRFQGRKAFFFEKKKQRTFLRGVRAGLQPSVAGRLHPAPAAPCEDRPSLPPPPAPA